MRRVARWLIEVGARRLSFDVAMFTAKQLLAAQGFGSGGTMLTSGELGVFHLINSDGPVLFDVGAHIGEYSEQFLTRFPNGRAFAFEPSASHLKILRERVLNFQRCCIFPVGLG